MVTVTAGADELDRLSVSGIELSKHGVNWVEALSVATLVAD